MTPKAKIEAYLSHHNLSQTHFAELTNIAQSRLNDLIRNDKPVTLRLAIPIAKKLGMTIDEFMDPGVDWPGPQRDAPARTITDEEAQILDLARQLQVAGLDWHEVARCRLLGLPLPEGRDLVVTGGRPPAAEPAPARKRG